MGLIKLPINTGWSKCFEFYIARYIKLPFTFADPMILFRCFTKRYFEWYNEYAANTITITLLYYKSNTDFNAIDRDM